MTRSLRPAQRGWPWLNAVAGQEPYRSGFRPVLGERGMVATPHPLAAQAGLGVLRQGGNAVDAAVAASAVLMVVVPMQCSPGGDAFWIVAPPHAAPCVLDASGAAPTAVDPNVLRALGHSVVPARSGWAVTVPGAVSGWAAALERFGTRTLDELLAPAVELAERGFFIGRHLRASIASAEPVLRGSAQGAEWYLPHGIPNLYSRLQQPELAKTLRELSSTNGGSLYTGALAQAVAAAIQQSQGWLSLSDLARHSPRWAEPLGAHWRGLTVYQPPPSAQGTVLLAALGMVAARGDTPLNLDEGASHHVMIEALRAARADFDAYGADPDEMTLTAGTLLDASYLHQRSRRIDSARAHPAWTPGLAGSHHADPAIRERDGDTAHLAVVDRDGMAVSLTQSLFYDFGSGVPVAGWGFFLQNRGASFSLTPGAANELSGGARPPHTLVPGLASSNGQVKLVMGAMGGTGQPQTLFQLLARLLDEELDPAEAIASPRWYADSTWHDRSRLYVESRFPRKVVADLRARGHDVIGLGPFEDVMGHAQVIAIDAGGALIGGADPRADAAVAAW